MYDFQKASIWKRISAALFDFILLSIVVTGAACLISLAINYGSQYAKLDALYDAKEKEYGLEAAEIEFGDDYNSFTEEQKAIYDTAIEALSKDEAFQKEFSILATTIFNYTLIITSFSILIGFLVVELLFPLIFKNGQTLGKKIFGVAVMRIDGVKVSPLLMFIRTVLGKYTIEVMIPVFIGLLIYFGVIGFGNLSTMTIGLVVVVALLVLQVILLLTSKARTPIHDKLASTVTVDYVTQMIFDSKEEMIAYQKRIHDEQANTTTDTADTNTEGNNF